MAAIAVATVAGSLRVERMAETVVDSTVRIFDLISAIKDYSYMDQAPIQDVDLAQSLENTLVMFNSRLKNVTVELNFDPDLPPVSAYGSELNQVWTALIENALESMNDMGTLRLLTHLNGSMALVEVWDDGADILDLLGMPDGVSAQRGQTACEQLPACRPGILPPGSA